jgi:hypothetical protein
MSPFALLRDAFNARDVRRWTRKQRFPATLERTYWSAYEYQRDRKRLEQAGYRASQERTTAGSSAATVDVAAPFFDKGVAYAFATSHYEAWLRRAPVVYRVSYERLSAWATTVRAAQNH